MSAQSYIPQLGHKVREKIAGFSGVVVGICAYLYGDSKVCVRSSTLHGGEVKEAWFNTDEVEKIGLPDQP